MVDRYGLGAIKMRVGLGDFMMRYDGNLHRYGVWGRWKGTDFLDNRLL